MANPPSSNDFMPLPSNIQAMVKRDVSVALLKQQGIASTLPWYDQFITDYGNAWKTFKGSTPIMKG